jgi:hypothetical protein
MLHKCSSGGDLCYFVGKIMNNYVLERIGSIMAGGGLAWATYAATKGVNLNDLVQDGFRRLLHETGPREVCAIGILLWILGKWRRNTLVR